MAEGLSARGAAPFLRKNQSRFYVIEAHGR